MCSDLVNKGVVGVVVGVGARQYNKNINKHQMKQQRQHVAMNAARSYSPWRLIVALPQKLDAVRHEARYHGGNDEPKP